MQAQYLTSHLGQLSLAIPSWVGVMCTSESCILALAV